MTSSDADKKEPLRNRRKVAGLIASAVGVALSLFLLLTHTFPEVLALPDAGELSMKTIGYTMMGTGKYQYLLPFELVSVLLLACIVGGLMIARKRQ